MEKLKILVVDDDEGVCLLLKKILENTNKYNVVSTTESLIAEELCTKEKPALLIIDNVMPQMKGSEVIKKLRENGAMKGMPIIMLTGKGEMTYSDKKEGFEWNPNTPIVKERGELEEQKGPDSITDAYGVDEYIPKPVNSNVLLSVVDEVLAKKRERDELEEWKRNNM